MLPGGCGGWGGIGDAHSPGHFRCQGVDDEENPAQETEEPVEKPGACRSWYLAKADSDQYCPVLLLGPARRELRSLHPSTLCLEDRRGLDQSCGDETLAGLEENRRERIAESEGDSSFKEGCCK